MSLLSGYGERLYRDSYMDIVLYRVIWREIGGSRLMTDISKIIAKNGAGQMLSKEDR